MYRFFLLFLGFLTLPASAAGLGLNPFEKNSPTSPTGAQNSRTTNPSSAPAPKPPSHSVAPQPKPAVPPAKNLTPQEPKR